MSPSSVWHGVDSGVPGGSVQQPSHLLNSRLCPDQEWVLDVHEPACPFEPQKQGPSQLGPLPAQGMCVYAGFTMCVQLHACIMALCS